MTTSTQDFDWRELVKETEGEAYYAKPVQYEFSNGRKFVEQPNSGVYENP